MAKTYEEMKKAYETAKKAIEECHAEIKNNERMVGQTAGIIQEGAKEIGLRVQQLKDGGATGRAARHAFRRCPIRPGRAATGRARRPHRDTPHRPRAAGRWDA